MGPAGGNVIDVQDCAGEALVEDAGLNLERNLRGDEFGFDIAEGVQAERGEPQGHDCGEDRAENGENTDGKQDAFAADAQGGEGDDFAVHGHAAEAEEDADEDGHRDCENQDARQNAEKKQADLAAGAGVTDEDFHKADQLGDEENEREDEDAEEGVAYYFTNNVAVQ